MIVERVIRFFTSQNSGETLVILAGAYWTVLFRREKLDFAFNSNFNGTNSRNRARRTKFTLASPTDLARIQFLAKKTKNKNSLYEKPYSSRVRRRCQIYPIKYPMSIKQPMKVFWKIRFLKQTVLNKVVLKSVKSFAKSFKSRCYGAHFLFFCCLQFTKGLLHTRFTRILITDFKNGHFPKHHSKTASAHLRFSETKPWLWRYFVVVAVLLETK